MAEQGLAGRRLPDHVVLRDPRAAQTGEPCRELTDVAGEDDRGERAIGLPDVAQLPGQLRGSLVGHVVDLVGRQTGLPLVREDSREAVTDPVEIGRVEKPLDDQEAVPAVGLDLLAVGSITARVYTRCGASEERRSVASVANRGGSERALDAERDRAVTDDRRAREPDIDVRRNKDAKHQRLDASDATGKREGRAELAEHVGEDQDGERRPSADRMEGGPQCSAVAGPPADGREQRRRPTQTAAEVGDALRDRLEPGPGAGPP